MFGQKLISTLIEIHGMIKNYYILVLVIYYEYIVVVIMIDFKKHGFTPTFIVFATIRGFYKRPSITNFTKRISSVFYRISILKQKV